MKTRSRSIGSILAGTFALLSFTAALHAGPRSSANYSIVTDAAEVGGGRSTSVAYTNDGSAGGIAGLSTVAAPAETMKHGYIGQLTEVTALQLAASPTTVNEGTTRQLTATATLDDATTSALLGTDVTWSVQSGPLTSISTSGLATAGVVYQNTAATAQGVYSGNIGTLNLTIINVNTDNFGSYAGDGIGDDWQVQYFGLSNPNAAPQIDPDFDGHNNLFEYTAGIIPTSALSVFRLRIEPVPGQPAQKKLIFSPRFTDRTYTVRFSEALGNGASWSGLGAAPPTIDNGNERTITDTSAAGAARFYMIDITKP